MLPPVSPARCDIARAPHHADPRFDLDSPLALDPDFAAWAAERAADARDHQMAAAEGGAL